MFLAVIFLSLAASFIASAAVLFIFDLSISTPLIWVLFIGFTVLFILLFYLIKGVITRCPKCKKRSSMKEIERTLINSYETTMKDTTYEKNMYGKPTGKKYERIVPATRYIYECTDECIHCGFQRKVRREETRRK